MNIAVSIVDAIRRSFSSIRVRLMMFFIVALALSLALAGFNIHVVAGNIMDRMSENATLAEVSQICDNLQNQLESVRTQMTILQHDSNMSALMNHSIFSRLEQVQIKNSFRKTVTSLLASFPKFKSVGLYSEKDECLMVFSSKSVQSYHADASIGWIRDRHVKQRLGEMVFFSGEEVQYGSPLMMHFFGNSRIICASFKIPGGMLLLAYEEQMLSEQYTALTQINGHSVYIINGENDILSASDRTTVNETYREPDTDDLRIYREKLEISDMTFIYHVAANTGYVAELNDLTRMTTISLVMAFFITAGIFLIWLNRMMRPVSGIGASMVHVERGDYSFPVDAPGSDELSKLARQYNDMLVSLQRLTDENAQAEQKRRTYELQALRNQINPHFLYNTLNTIKWMAMMEGSDKVAECLTSLGGLLSPLLKANNPLCTLREEMDLSYRYMSLMNTRYMVEMPVDADIPEELMDVAVPRLCLQPILENAILHGFAPAKKWGCITISVFEEGGYVFLDVRDDGAGMSRDAIDALNLRLASGEQSERIGIVNTNMRIRLHYGEDCGLHISENPYGGLCVRIRIRRVEIT